MPRGDGPGSLLAVFAVNHGDKPSDQGLLKPNTVYVRVKIYTFGLQLYQK